MKLRISIVIFYVFLWFQDSTQCSLSCVRTFLRENNVKQMILVDQRSDLSLSALFDTMDWSVTVFANRTSALFDVPPGFDVIITTSVAHIRVSSNSLKKRRVYVILNDMHPSIDAILSIFLEFTENVRRSVIVIARVARDQWRFYRFNEFDCTNNGAVSVDAFAECNVEESFGYLIQSTKYTNLDGMTCPLLAVATKCKPLTYYDESRGLFKGADYYLVENIAKRLQMDVNFVQDELNPAKSVLCKSHSLHPNDLYLKLDFQESRYSGSRQSVCTSP